mmetsp:Transcript_9238/g.37785  ORF Transcript_9238/g.37785 Transcript_9238/m.37785 type:complete len:420 (-) Transcript_9238:2425-3684(-)
MTLRRKLLSHGLLLLLGGVAVGADVGGAHRGGGGGDGGAGPRASPRCPRAGARRRRRRLLLRLGRFLLSPAEPPAASSRRLRGRRRHLLDDVLVLLLLDLHGRRGASASGRRLALHYFPGVSPARPQDPLVRDDGFLRLHRSLRRGRLPSPRDDVHVTLDGHRGVGLAVLVPAHADLRQRRTNDLLAHERAPGAGHQPFHVLQEPRKLHGLSVRALHLRGLHAVVAVRQLDDPAGAVAHRAVVPQGQVLERFHEPARHVPSLRRLHRGVDEALAAGHGVEEELGGSHPAEEGVGDETLRRRGLLAASEVRQRSLRESVWGPHAPHGLLPDARHHLRDVDGGSLAAAERHDERSVVARELVEAHVPGGFSHRGENPEHLRLQGLLGVAPRLQRERAPLESLDALVAGVVAAVDHLALLVL